MGSCLDGYEPISFELCIMLDLTKLSILIPIELPWSILKVTGLNCFELYSKSQGYKIRKLPFVVKQQEGNNTFVKKKPRYGK